MVGSRSGARVGVGVVVTDQAGRLLLGYRIKAGETPSWCLPGGHVEAGESFERAAGREVEEEAGLSRLEDVRVVSVLIARDDPACTALTGAVEARSNDPAAATVREPDIFSQWRWFAPDQLPWPLFPATAAVLAFRRGDPLPPGWIGYAVSRTCATDPRP